MTQCSGQNCSCAGGGTANRAHTGPVSAGKEKSSHERQDVFRLEKLDCADCAAKLETRLAALPGVSSVKVNFGAAKMTVRHSTGVDVITGAVKEAGYTARLYHLSRAVESKPFWHHVNTWSTAVSGLFLLAGFISLSLDAPGTAGIALYLAAIVCGGYNVGKSALSSIKVRSLDMNVLMSVAIIGAVAIGEWAEGATAMFLFSLGNTLQAYSMDRSRNSIRELMDLTPPVATVKRERGEITIPVEDILVGDLMIVKPGERIAMDGRVLAGASRVNQAPITGESMPVLKTRHSEVFAGTLNEDGVLEVEVTRLVHDTTLARIVDMVEEAQAQRAPSQQFVDSFARYYTPAVIAVAVAIAALPPLIGGLPFIPWLERALIMLVIACPCALVISTPVAIVSAIGSAARRGVLIKGGLFLEEAGRVKVVAFDKTGTLTSGRPEVTDIIPAPDYTARDVLYIAAAVESRSQHPLGQAVVRHARSLGLDTPVGVNLQAVPGKGARAEVDGRPCLVGNAEFFSSRGLDVAVMEDNMLRLQEEGKTTMLVGSDSRVVGVIAMADRVRPAGREALQNLKQAGMKKIVMLTGDNANTARSIASKVGIDEFKAGLLPGQKLHAINQLRDEYGKVAMVGDGINDAPALAAADIGIAMGKAGTDTALETADIVLMSDELAKLPYVVRLSRQALRIIKQNIAFSLLVKFIFIVGTIYGVTNLWMAVFADTGAALLVIANGMRLMAVKENLVKPV